MSGLTSPTKYIQSLLSKSDEKQCVLESKQISKITPLGDASLYGDISLIELDNGATKAVLKKIPLTNGTPDDLTTSIGVEIKMLELVTELVNQGVTDGFSTLSDKSIFAKCKYTNPNLPKKASKCLTTISPFATDGTLKNFLLKIRKKRASSDYDISIAYFQIFAALYAMQNYFNASHHDLHWSNVFLTKNENYIKGTYDLYQIEGKQYYLPSYPYTFQIADLGFARIPRKLEIAREAEYYKEDSQKQRLAADYSRISSMLWQISLDEDLDIPRTAYIKNILDTCFQHYKIGSPVSVVIPLLFSEFQMRPKNARINRVWDHDKALPDFNPELASYLRRPAKQMELIAPLRGAEKALNKYEFQLACQQLLSDPRIYETE